MDNNIVVKINKIKNLYEKKSYKEALNFVNIYRLKYQELNQIPFFFKPCWVITFSFERLG